MDQTELKARLGEDEAAARALCDGDWGDRPWAVTECSDAEADNCPCIVYQGEYKPFDEAQVPLIRYIADAEAPLIAEHIVRYDPARVLRQVAAMRKILAEHEREHYNDPYSNGLAFAVECLEEIYRDERKP